MNPLPHRSLRALPLLLASGSAALAAPASGPPEAAAAAPAPTTGRVALGTAGALGVTGAGFYNHLVGARYDLDFPGRFTVGAGAAYANLKGPDGRAGNVLVSALLEHRFEARAVEIPLRFSAGYLPRNGPVVRLATGLAFPLGSGTRLTLDLLAPTFWAARDRTAISFDFGAEISFVP